MQIAILKISWAKPTCTIILLGLLYGSGTTQVSEEFLIPTWTTFRYVGNPEQNTLPVCTSELRRRI